MPARGTKRGSPNRKPTPASRGHTPDPSPEDLVGVEDELRRLVTRADPHLRMERHWAIDWYVGTDLIVCIGRFSRHVGVEFWRGRSLVEAGHPLEGTGKNLRHLKIRTLEQVRTPVVLRAVHAAVRLDHASPKRVR